MVDGGPPRGRVLAVVPTLGERVDTLGAALASLRSSGVACTIVVVAPVDAQHARLVAEEHGAVLVDDPRSGLSAAVNAAIRAAGPEEYFAWIGDDDLVRPGGLSTLVALLDRHRDAVAAYGACEYIDEADRVLGTSRAGRWASRVLPWGPNLIPQPASLSRLSAMAEAGSYDESLRYAMDLDMFLRLRRLGPLVATSRTVAAYRWHPDAITVANRDLSLREADGIRLRYVPTRIRPLAPLWSLPIRGVMTVVSSQLSRRARRAAA